MALTDVDYKDQGPSITGESNIWPFQASSPPHTEEVVGKAEQGCCGGDASLDYR